METDHLALYLHNDQWALCINPIIQHLIHSLQGLAVSSVCVKVHLCEIPYFGSWWNKHCINLVSTL